MALSYLQGVLASRVLELLWGMIMAPDGHADVVSTAIKGLRAALFSYDTALDEIEVQPPCVMPSLPSIHRSEGRSCKKSSARSTRACFVSSTSCNRSTDR